MGNERIVGRRVTPEWPEALNVPDPLAKRAAGLSKLFVRGPIPMTWLSAAARLPGKAMHVAMLLWFRRGCEKAATFRLTREHRQLFDLDRHAVYRALKALEHARLISVDQKSGRCPIVTLFRDRPAAEPTVSTG